MNRTRMARSETLTTTGGHCKLPLTSVNHISFAVPHPQKTALFFQKVLGFVRLPRPAAFENSFDGAWVCGMGLEIHFIQPKNTMPQIRATQLHEKGIDPRNDHLSFLCKWDESGNSDFDSVKTLLKDAAVQFLERDIAGEDLKQLFFCDPTSGLLIEISTNPKC